MNVKHPWEELPEEWSPEFELHHRRSGKSSPSPILPFLAPLLEELVLHEGDPVVWAPNVRASDLKAGLERSESGVEAACGALLRAAVRRYVLSSSAGKGGSS